MEAFEPYVRSLESLTLRVGSLVSANAEDQGHNALTLPTCRSYTTS
jgi:hypothetical protein